MSNYLMQSVVCTTIFYGYGLGLFGRVDRVGQLMVVAGVWIVEMGASRLWLRYFSAGPIEWLWRSATYGRWLPLRAHELPAIGDDDSERHRRNSIHPAP